MDIKEESLELHKRNRGKISIQSKISLSKETLKLAYTPGVAEPCLRIAQDKNLVWDYTFKGNTVAVVSDGSAVLGLGNIGPLAGLPVMEGKAILFKELAGIDAFPIVLDTQNTEEIIKTVKNIAPTFGGINLEDIAAPRCFEVEEKLQDIGIPVFHDDQHGTEIVVLSALMNACRVLKKNIADLTVVISGAGAAGLSIAKTLQCVDIDKQICAPINNLILCDSVGIIHKERTDLNESKAKMLMYLNRENKRGGLKDALEGADVFIGVSKPGVLKPEMIKSMNEDPIIFAMANPTPEIMPDQALKAGAGIVATGRSDFPNQINNALAFPGVFRGALDVRATKINSEMRMAAIRALAGYVKNPERDQLLPPVLDKNAVGIVADAVKKAAIETGVARV